jgi:hypothetical protein
MSKASTRAQARVHQLLHARTEAKSHNPFRRLFLYLVFATLVAAMMDQSTNNSNLYEHLM